MARALRMVLPVVFVLWLSAPPTVSAEPWPQQAVAEFNQAADALAGAQTPGERVAAIATMRDVARAYPSADGSTLVAEMLDRTQAGESAHANTVEALAVLADAGALDAETYGRIAGPLVESAMDLAEIGDIVPSQAIRLNDAIEELDEAAAEAGLPKVSDLAPGLSEKLSEFADLVETYRDLQDLDDADEAHLKETLDRLLDLAGKFNPVFRTSATVPFRDHLAWQKSMFDESTAALDLVSEAIETGRFNNEAYKKIADRLEKLARGPWGADTAKDFLSKLCDSLPVLQKACKDLFGALADAVVNCSKIDCDCANVGGGILSGPNRVSCELTQASLIAACAAEGKITGTCDAGASGPAAFPK